MEAVKEAVEIDLMIEAFNPKVIKLSKLEHLGYTGPFPQTLTVHNMNTVFTIYNWFYFNSIEYFLKLDKIHYNLR